MKRRHSFKRGIRRLDELLARYASRQGLLDALNAMAILEGAGAPTLTELALDALRREKGRGRAVASLTVRELFERRLASFSAEQERSRRATGVAMRHFCRALGGDTPVETLTKDAILDALARFRAPRTFNSYLQHLRTALNLAVKIRALDASPVQDIAPKRIDWTEPVFLPPGKVERIFRLLEEHPGAPESGLGAYFSLGFFAGVRTAELLRASWEDLDLDGAVLRIPRPKGFTKGRRPRLVELEDNAVAWLRTWHDWTAAALGRAPSGRIVRGEHDVRNWKAKRLAPEGLSWGNDEAHNAARHTYATMHVGAFRDAAATALNLGHVRGTELLDRHYRGLVAQAVAKTYWDIRPSRTPAAPEPLPGRGWRTDLHGERRSENRSSEACLRSVPDLTSNNPSLIPRLS